MKNHTSKITAIASLAILIATGSLIALSARADEIRRDRLDGLLKTSPIIEPLEKYGYGEATFLSYKDTDMASASFGVELCILEVPRGSGHLQVKDLRVDKSTSEVFQSSFPLSSIGVMTGGFFGLDTKGKPIPLGLVKTAGKTITPVHPWKSGGVVAVSKKQVQIIPIAEFANATIYSDVIQSKPMLVEAGKDGIRAPTSDRFDRSAIAVDRVGTTYFFVLHEQAGSAASLAEFSYVLLSFRSTKGKSIDFALAMDGGPGAHMYISALKKHCGSGSATFVPNALYFTK